MAIAIWAVPWKDNSCSYDAVILAPHPPHSPHLSCFLQAKTRIVAQVYRRLSWKEPLRSSIVYHPHRHPSPTDMVPNKIVIYIYVCSTLDAASLTLLHVVDELVEFNLHVSDTSDQSSFLFDGGGHEDESDNVLDGVGEVDNDLASAKMLGKERVGMHERRFVDVGECRLVLCPVRRSGGRC